MACTSYLKSQRLLYRVLPYRMSENFPALYTYYENYLKNVWFGGRDDLEAETSVNIIERTHQTDTQVVFYHCHVFAVSFHVTQLESYQ